MSQLLSNTTTSRTKRVVYNFTRRIYYFRLTRVNQARVKIRGLDTGNRNPKVDAQNLAQIWGVGINRAN